MEAASFAASTSAPLYDVFINYCEFDVKNTIASAINQWLEEKGVTVFFLKPELQSDQELSTTVVEAIHGASVHIAIFSRRYAECFWCLDELCLILESNGRIIPVFYDVLPSELRCIEQGAYSCAFAEYEEEGTFNRRILSQWKAALNNVADYSGFQLNEFDGDEGELLIHVVDRALKELVKLNPDDAIGGRLFGLDEAVERFELNLRTVGGERKMVMGIVGTAGSGKTTLAKELYHRKRSSFHRSSLLCDIASGNNSLEKFQSKLLKDLAGIERKFDNTSEGRQSLKHHLRLLKLSRVLVVLDDIDHKDQLDALLLLHVLGPGSLIIVTSRDIGLLSRSAVRSIRKLGGLGSKHARELFCWHAFQQPYPINGFGGLVNESLTKCRGLPLLIKLLSGHLSLCGDNSEEDWKEELDKISNNFEILKIIYDSLWEEEKQIFLDIACFFVGEEKSLAIRVWDESGWRASRALQTLESKLLVELDQKNRLQMHRHVRDFGRAIASKQSPRRLWCPDLDIYTAEPLKDGMEVRGIMASRTSGESDGDDEWMRSQKPTLEEKQPLEDVLEISQTRSFFVGLKLLVISGHRFESAHTCSTVSRELLWLRWFDYPHSVLPSWLSMGNLRVLEINGHHIQKLWQGKPPLQLRELTIHCRGRLEEIPQSIGSLIYLEKIVLNCGEVMCSHTLPDELFSLQSLQHLEFHCKSLMSLPNRFGHLTNIQCINFSGCSELRMLPESFGCLTRLRYLNLKNCERLIIQPQNFGEITTLENLNFKNCNQMQVLPTQTTCQESLKKLDLAGIILQEFPESTFRSMSNLQILRIGSPFLTSLPPIGDLAGLTHLELDGCTKLTCLPESLGQLNHLTHLSIISSAVQNLPKGLGLLTNLQELTIRNCPIREITFGNARDFELGEETPDTKKPRLIKIRRRILNRLRNVRLINTDVSKISILEDLCPELARLDLSYNRHLIEVEALPTTLEYLAFEGCGMLKRISGISDLPKLQVLIINGCFELDEINASGCSMLRQIAGLETLEKLRLLDVSRCFGLYELSIPAPLNSLETLNASGCEKLLQIQGLENLTMLRSLDLSGCSRLYHLSIPADLNSLETLKVSGCTMLRRIRGLENLPKLRLLALGRCSQLSDLSIPAHLNSLETLINPNYSFEKLQVDESGNPRHIPDPDLQSHKPQEKDKTNSSPEPLSR